MKQRIITGAIAGAVFLLLLFLGGYWYSGMIFVLAMVAYSEYLRMNRLKIVKAGSLISFAGLFMMTFPLIEPTLHQLIVFIWITMFALFVMTVVSKNKMTIDAVATYLLGMIYIGFGFHFMAATGDLQDGRFWALLIFVSIWATDSGAYFTGYTLGRKPLWPAISPKKTIEGSLGGIVFAVIAAVCFSLYAPDLLPLGKSVVLGLVIALVSQMGDLIQSAYKRVKGIKDTGTILPGHGGVLDRTDSWIIVFPFLHLLSLLPIT